MDHVRPRSLVVWAGVISLLALLVSLSIATAGTNHSARSTAMAAPKVPNAAAIKAKYGGQSITFVGDSVGGHLVEMPWFGDFGMLYYRTDLLKKYAYSKPPTTWTQLFAMAKNIQDGEKASSPNFTGFVFQGNAYEGLTCDSLEWIASSGGGNIIESGKVTINNPKAIAMLNAAKGWIGTISPQGVTSYQEEDARHVFQSCNAAVSGNWT